MFSSLFLIFSILITTSNCINETETKLHFYFHDIVTGSNPTAIRIAQASTTNSSSSFFGALVMIDDPLTETPDPKSKLIGRAQGMYAMASQEEAGLMMVMNFHFVQGEYNGSTLAVLGRNAVMSGIREMPIIGGSKMFRFARGYAQAKTYQLDMSTGNAIVEYNVRVLHEDVKLVDTNSNSNSNFDDPKPAGSGAGDLHFGGFFVLVSVFSVVYSCLI